MHGAVLFVMMALWLSAGVPAAFATDNEAAAKGAEKSLKTEILETGAAALQTTAPLESLNIHIVGFHPMKDDPAHQMTAHHFCHQVNEDFAQCVLYDDSGSTARLNGIEYIISERLFNDLPEEERQYWHPHNYEILSGQLVAPGLPEIAEKELMRSKMNSYGKTWHVWNTGSGPKAGGADNLPLGPAHLAWSFNHDGEAQPGLVEARDAALDIDSAAKRAERQDLVPLARPQHGVNALRDQFAGPLQEIEGVSDAGEAQ